LALNIPAAPICRITYGLVPIVGPIRDLVSLDNVSGILDMPSGAKEDLAQLTDKMRSSKKAIPMIAQ
jgi:hypothetical protein